MTRPGGTESSSLIRLSRGVSQPLAGMGGGIAPAVLHQAAEVGARFGADDSAPSVFATSSWEERPRVDEAAASTEVASPADTARAPKGLK